MAQRVFILATLLVLSDSVFTCGAGQANKQPAKGSAVALSIVEATAQLGDGYILFSFDVTLNNTVGKELTVRSNFHSIFDGMSIVVMNQDGKVLRKQSTLYYQSPLADTPEREFPVKEGITKDTLSFRIRDLPRDTVVFKIRLEGTLPGSGYEPVVVSQTIEVKVKK
jgi:hypothetical protein